ncbi:outer membrane lipoprotein carrier protein LolA [Kitasatospora sp. GAS1066B]|uniref:LolA family protein n=1 Tax=Kitasatospora sp. GAS1066B TaxID=3156271 RepID=UPI003513D71D
MTTKYAGFEEPEPAGGDEPIGVPYRGRRRTAARVLVPVAIAAVAAAGVAVVPALASPGTPTLPQVTAQQLVTKVLANRTTALSGTVQVSTDLGIPSQVLDMASQGAVAGVTGAAGAAGGSGQAKEGAANAASAGPQAKLTTLLAGDHTLRVAADGPDKQRVALVEPLAEYDLIHNGDQAWAWDSASNQAVHLSDGTGGAAAKDAKEQPKTPLDGVPTTPQQAAQQFLAGSASSSDVSVAGTVSVAGRDAYQLSVKPKQSGSTIREVKIAVDSATGTPLAVVATSTSGSTVLDVHFSDVSFAVPSASTFDFTPPKGATVVQPAQQRKWDNGIQPQPEASKAGSKVTGTDWTAVVSFTLPTQSGSTQTGSTQTGGGKAASGHHRKQALPDSTTLIKSLGKPVAGGTLISTKVINVLITDDNHVYAGAVTLPVLQAAAGVK